MNGCVNSEGVNPYPYGHFKWIFSSYRAISTGHKNAMMSL